MNHSFNIDIAKKYGIEEAILIENIAFWLKKNIANKKNFNDEYNWIYNSASAFNELFPYINPSKIRRSLLKLEDENVLLSGNYNKLKYDRTKWYTIIDNYILQNYNIHYTNCIMEINKVNNGNEQTVTPIPDINTDIKTNINTDKKIYIILFDYYLSLELIKHKKITKDMKKAIDKAKNELELTIEEMKAMLKRHEEKVLLTKDNDLPVKKRTLSEFFGQKKFGSVSLICTDYLEEVYQKPIIKNQGKKVSKVMEHNLKVAERFLNKG